jgi:hypothetical protein
MKKAEPFDPASVGVVPAFSWQPIVRLAYIFPQKSKSLPFVAALYTPTNKTGRAE